MIPLTPREREVAEHLATDTLPRHELAKFLGIAKGTLAHHTGRIYQKLNVRNRVQLMLYWEREMAKKA